MIAGLIGVDPSLTGTGLVAMRVELPLPLADQTWPFHPSRVQLVDRCTVRTAPSMGSLTLRLLHLSDCVAAWVAETLSEVQADHWCVAVEDPTVFTTFRGEKRSQAVLAQTGAAFGCALAAVRSSAAVGVPIVGIPVTTWYPREKGKRGSHPVKKDWVIAHFRATYKPLLGGLLVKEEDQIMAFAMAAIALRRGLLPGCEP
jgi:hypothetical protein